MAISLPSSKLGAGVAAGAFFIVCQTITAAFARTSANIGAEPIAGAARVIDGDTLEVAGTRIRLEGIDAPELAQTCETSAGQSWPCGQAAASRMRALIADNNVDCDVTGIDKYRRQLAICYAAGSNLNQTMVRAGFAWAFVKYSTAFVAEEAEARAAHLGVWQGSATAPWDFRHSEWQVAEKTAPNGCSIKGNISGNGRIYHVPWSRWYDNVRIDEARGERWFCSEAEALAAGWRAPAP